MRVLRNGFFRGWFALFLFAAIMPAPAETNIWTKPNSGFWEEQAFWSLGVRPNAAHDILFTNAGWKALAIGANTAQNFPESMRVQSLRVSAPVDSYNTLLMNWSGFERPLQTTSLTVDSNSTVAVHGSALEVLGSTGGNTGNLSLGGILIHADYSLVKVQGLLNVQRLGISSQPWTAEPGRYFLTNGILAVDGLENIGGMSGPGRFVQHGGSNNVGSLQIGPLGNFELYGGQVTATNGFSVGYGDFASDAHFTQYGGNVTADSDVNGNYVLNGGTITGRMAVPSTTSFDRADGRVAQNGGTNFAASLEMGLHAGRMGGAGYYVLSNGVLRVSSSVTLRGGTFSQFNGEHTITSSLNMPGFAMSGLSSASAYYILQGGTLSAGGLTAQAAIFQQTGGTNSISGDVVLTSRPPETTVPLESALYTLSGGSFSARNVILNTFFGGFRQSGGSSRIAEQLTVNGPTNSVGFTLEGGSLRANNIVVTNEAPFYHSGGTNDTVRLALINGGRYELSGGTLITSNTIVENYLAPVRPRFVQTAGEHRVKRLLWLESGGVYELNGGRLSTDLISLRAATQLHLKGGTVSSNNVFELNGGTLYLDGNYSLGWLRFNGTGRIDFGSGSSIVHFTKVGYPPPALDGELLIHNWKGSAKSPGQDQLYIDTADEYTHLRLQSIKFIDPAGYPPGTYRAWRKASGEIVPLDRPGITVTRDAGRMVLSWPEGYELYAADKVTGPFERVVDAQSGWSAAFTDPQRFFVLRPAQ